MFVINVDCAKKNNWNVVCRTAVEYEIRCHESLYENVLRACGNSVRDDFKLSEHPVNTESRRTV